MSENILQIRSNGQITLPSSVRRRANLKEGDLLEVSVEPDGSLRLSPKIVVDREQAFFWTKRWQGEEQKISADIETGKYLDFSSIKDLIDELDNLEDAEDQP